MTFHADPSETPDPGLDQRRRDSRRRLLRSSLAAPVLMTLANRSAFGCTATTPSAFGSINASRPDNEVRACGVSPGYWKNHTGNWPSPYRATASHGPGPSTPPTLFDSVFTGGRFPGRTLLDILSPELKFAGNNGGDVAVARAVVAALLNAAAGKTIGVLDVDQVKNIWTEFITKGYFSPTNGVKWYSNYTEPMPSDPHYGGGILGYLSSTWT